jgi:hypothetical protein
MQKKIQKIEIKESGCLFVTIEDIEDKTIQTFEFFFVFGWRIKDATGALITAVFNDPKDTDESFLKLIGEKVNSIQFDKYDCKIEIANGFCIESFAISNFAADYGFLSEEALNTLAVYRVD